MLAALSVTLLVALAASPLAFAQSGLDGVDKEEGEWHVGENLRVGDYFSYDMCHIDHRECDDEFNFQIWFSETTQVGSQEQWLAEVVVQDDARTLVGNVTLGGSPSLTLVESSMNLAGYERWFDQSVLWMSGLFQGDLRSAESGWPKKFADESWGRISRIGGENATPSGTQDVTGPAGVWEDAVVVSWIAGGYYSKVWVADGFPFPIKAEAISHVHLFNMEYEFEIQDYGNLQESPFGNRIHASHERASTGELEEPLQLLATDSTTESIPTPLRQARNGVAPSEVVCSDERVLVQSPSGSPACVFAESAKTLELRGFVLLSGDPRDIPFVEKPDAPENPGVGSAGTDNLGDRPFVTTWRITSPDEPITIPVGGATGAYTVDWGDGSVSANVTGDHDHAYADPGEYAVSISGDFTRILLGKNSDNAGKLVSIDQWGDIRWESMNRAFSGAVFQDNAADAPDLSMVTDMSSMFQSSSFNGNLTDWDVSGVEDMSWMFANSGFSGDISGWNMSGVTTMEAMFLNSPFSGNLTDWDVSGVTTMEAMFYGSTFNSDISGWDVSGVTNMSEMFFGSTFNSDISGWDVSGVTDMYGMFFETWYFNSDISGWDVSGVTNMSGMFYTKDEKLV